MNKITIVCPSILPIPAVLGGAVETIINNLVDYNEKFFKIKIEVVSIYQKKAYQKSKSYKNSLFTFVKCPVLLYRVNSIIHNLLCKRVPILYFELLYRKIKNNTENIIIVEGGIDFALFLLEKNENLKIVYHSHGHEFIHLNEKQISQINSFKKIFVVSEFCQNEAIKSGVLSDKLYLLKNGIRLEDFCVQYNNAEKAKFKKQYSINDSKKVILFKGRLVPEKGILELIEAVNGLQANNYLLLICGGKNFARKNIFQSSYEKSIKKAIKNNSNIMLLGHIAYEKVPMLNAISTLAVIPSRWDEPGALVVIEAIASGLPLVISNRGGIPEYVDQECALIIDSNNFVLDLRAAIDKILLNDSLREKMKLGSIKKRHEFDLDEYFNGFIRGLILDEC